MNKSNFAEYLTIFLSSYLPTRRSVSANTVSSYCDTFRLLLRYYRDVMKIKVESLQLADITQETVEGFLDWLESERNCGVSTQNQRLAAIHSFIRYVQIEEPDKLLQFQRVLSIPQKKKAAPTVTYLSKEDVALILAQPDVTRTSGRRDLVIISVLYDTAARVQEICDLRVQDLRLEKPASIRLTGKGNKARDVPILSGTVELLKRYIEENRLQPADKVSYLLFTNRSNEKLTRAGITYILNKYVSMARRNSSTIPEKITPHVLRHTKAMHLCEANVNLIYIRDILGHSDVKTTGIYARANLQMKREALEKISDSPSVSLPQWLKEPDLLNWLKNLGQS